MKSLKPYFSDLFLQMQLRFNSIAPLTDKSYSLFKTADIKVISTSTVIALVDNETFGIFDGKTFQDVVARVGEYSWITNSLSKLN